MLAASSSSETPETEAGEAPAAPATYAAMSTIYGAFARVGKLEPPTTVVSGQGPDTGAAKPQGHSVFFTEDNRFLITADKGLNRMLVFRFDAVKGTLTPNQPPCTN